MTGDFSNPFVEGVQQLLDAYCSSLRSVKLALPVKFKELIKSVCDIAQIELGTSAEIHSIKNYFVLVILMAGVIDDFEDALN